MNELPFRFKGKIFASGMPFSQDHDPGGRLFEQYQGQAVGAVVLLAADEECLKFTGRNLREFYEDQGLQVIYLPIRDLSIPDQEALSAAVEDALSRVEAGENLAVHCYAGVGRTGMFTACMAKRAFHLDGKGAIAWVRKVIPGAVETSEQKKLVDRFT